jgi:hypothetical protein
MKPSASLPASASGVSWPALADRPHRQARIVGSPGHARCQEILARRVSPGSSAMGQKVRIPLLCPRVLAPGTLLRGEVPRPVDPPVEHKACRTEGPSASGRRAARVGPPSQAGILPSVGAPRGLAADPRRRRAQREQEGSARAAARVPGPRAGTAFAFPRRARL